MRHVIMLLVVIGVFAIGVFAAPAPTAAALPENAEFPSTEAVNKWMANYWARPNPSRLPAVVRALSQLGALKEPEGAGVYVGFIAGVLGANPGKAEDLIAKMLPGVTPVDQWVIVRSIAYSGHPSWMRCLRKFKDQMSTREAMIEKYLDGRLQTLDEVGLELKEPSFWDKVRGNLVTGWVVKPAGLTLDRSPELLDTLWGYYFASHSPQPIKRVITLLPWSKERDSVDKLTMGNMAKYTLASNAARDAELLALRKDALASIEELKRKGPGSKRDMSTWGMIGQGALALGCIAAAAAGQIELGIPCVIGGAASGVALTYWNNQQ